MVMLSEYRPFAFEQGDPFVNITDVMEDIVSISEILPAGVYQLVISFIWQYDNITNSAEFQIIGDLPSPVFSMEPKDITNDHAWSYTFPLMHAGGAMNFTLQGANEATQTNTLTVPSSNIQVERKGE